MSIGITVEDFKYVRGVNDAEYIELLKNAYERQKRITSKAIAKLKEQPERKTGHWILYDKRFPWSKDYKCSECGNYLDFSGVNAGRGSANFCPNCGAKMEGEFDEQ